MSCSCTRTRIHKHIYQCQRKFHRNPFAISNATKNFVENVFHKVTFHAVAWKIINDRKKCSVSLASLEENGGFQVNIILKGCWNEGIDILLYQPGRFSNTIYPCVHLRYGTLLNSSNKRMDHSNLFYVHNRWRHQPGLQASMNTNRHGKSIFYIIWNKIK